MTKRPSVLETLPVTTRARTKTLDFKEDDEGDNMHPPDEKPATGVSQSNVCNSASADETGRKGADSPLRPFFVYRRIDEMAGDWLKLHRCILDSEVFSDDWLTRLWVWCMCKANFVDGVFRGRPIKRGQFITGRIAAATELNVSPSKWYRGMERLVAIGCVTTESNGNWTAVTVCNFDNYQSKEEKPEQPVIQRADSQRTAGDTTTGQPVIQPADTIEEGKNSIREEGKKGRRKRSAAASATADPKKPETTWLTPYNDIWKSCFGGDMAFGKESPHFRKLETEHEKAEVVAAWQTYCEQHEGEGQYASGATFARTYGQWSGSQRNGKKPVDLLRGIKEYMADTGGLLT